MSIVNCIKIVTAKVTCPNIHHSPDIQANNLEKFVYYLFNLCMHIFVNMLIHSMNLQQDGQNYKKLLIKIGKFDFLKYTTN